MTKTRILEFIVQIIGVILLIVFIYELINKILGHSWQIETFAAVLFSLILTGIFTVNAKINKIDGEFCHFKRSFGALASDFKEFKTNQEKFNNWSRAQFNNMNTQFSDIKRKLSKI